MSHPSTLDRSYPMNAKQIKEQEAEDAIARLSAECAGSILSLPVQTIELARLEAAERLLASEGD